MFPLLEGFGAAKVLSGKFTNLYKLSSAPDLTEAGPAVKGLQRHVVTNLLRNNCPSKTTTTSDCEL